MEDKKIMIVDDSPFQIAILSDIITQAGFNVAGSASSLEDAVSKAKELKPDLVTMDITMPGTDGFECTKEIHKVDSGIKVILVSSMMDDELIKKAKKYDISGYIQKPVDPEELTLLIKRVMADEELYMELSKIYSKVFRETTLDIFNRFTKTVPEVTDESNENTPIHIEGVSVVMGIIGKYSGRLIFDLPLETAQKLTSELLRREPKNAEEMFNAMAELANMLGGNACSMINKKNNLFGLRVAPPTTFHGESMNISKAKLDDTYSVKMKTKFGEMAISVGFRRGESKWTSII